MSPFQTRCPPSVLICPTLAPCPWLQHAPCCRSGLQTAVCRPWVDRSTLPRECRSTHHGSAAPWCSDALNRHERVSLIKIQQKTQNRYRKKKTACVCACTKATTRAQVNVCFKTFSLLSRHEISQDIKQRIKCKECFCLQKYLIQRSLFTV